ncbi:MAG: GNAT family N-acetyltransferase [Pseudomonadota bacterium]
MSAPDWFAIIDATWPAAAYYKESGWIIREGQGGGKRVSAASGSGDIAQAEKAQRALGQDLLFMIRPEDAALDAELDRLGYVIIDPVVVLAKALTTPKADAHQNTPSDATIGLWEAGGIGPARRAVMNRARGVKTVIQTKGGCGFVACHNDVAMIHALEVAADRRGLGIGTALEQQACTWAPTRKISALTVATNKASRALFKKAGYCEVSFYHYRIKDPDA